MELTVFAKNLSFPEGPISLKDGSVVLVELKSRHIKRVFPNGEQKIIATVDGAPNGAALGPNGEIYIVNNGGMSWVEHEGLIAPGPQPEDYIGGRVQIISTNGEVRDLYTHYEDGPILAPNDIIMDGAGGFYFTDHGQKRGHDMDLGALSYGRLDGSMVKRLVSPLFTPNGVGISPDGKRVYVSETITGRVWWWEVLEPGILNFSTKNKGANILAGLGGFTFFDSLAVDAAGNVNVATMPKGGITTISPEGEILDFVPVPIPDATVTNICFGGDNLDTAFITSSGTGILYKTQWKNKGLKLPFSDSLS